MSRFIMGTVVDCCALCNGSASNPESRHVLTPHSASIRTETHTGRHTERQTRALAGIHEWRQVSTDSATAIPGNTTNRQAGG